MEFGETHEIYDKLEGGHEEGGGKSAAGTMTWIIAQIMVVDIVFSLDSVITAVGVVPPEQLIVMYLAIIIAVLVMLFFAAPVGRFVNRNPTIKILALSFLILIGVLLVADGFGQHIPKGYIYFAMAFSLGVEFLNALVRRRNPVPVVQKKDEDEG